MSERVHITTAIFYCNGTPHVGSAYEALAADVFTRWQRREEWPRPSHVPERDGRARRQDSPRHVSQITPRLTPTKCPSCFARPSPGSTSVSTTRIRPPTRFTKSSCRRCSPGLMRAAISTSATTRDSTASIASASIPKRSCCPATSARPTLWPDGVASAGGNVDRVRRLRGLPSRDGNRRGWFQPRHGDGRHGPDCATLPMGGG